MTRRKVLTKDQVSAIRAQYKPNVRGHGYAAIAKKIGVGESTVRDCVKFWTYAGIK
jgi:transposase